MRFASLFLVGYAVFLAGVAAALWKLGVLQRVVDTARPVVMVSATEPAIRNLPAALCAVPVAAKGQVVGVLVVIRSKSEPFGDRESGALSDLAPVVEAALVEEVVTDVHR